MTKTPDFVLNSIKASIDSVIGGTHSYFIQEKYDSFVTYKIQFTNIVNVIGLYDINIYILDGKHKYGSVNLLLLNRYLNISSDIILELVKTYQHNGVWDGDKFVIMGDIKRKK